MSLSSNANITGTMVHENTSHIAHVNAKNSTILEGLNKDVLPCAHIIYKLSIYAPGRPFAQTLFQLIHRTTQQREGEGNPDSRL